MRKFSVFASILVLLSLALSACGAGQAPAATSTPTPDAKIVCSGTSPAGFGYALKKGQAQTNTMLNGDEEFVLCQGAGKVAISLLKAAVPPTSTLTPNGDALMGTVEAVATASGPQLRTAEDIRALGKVLGWVTGGESGEFVAGAQLELKNDVPLLDILQDGVVYEFQCVQYFVINGEVHTKVCDGGLVRFDTESMLPKGAVGTLWLPWAVQGSATEEWLEGFFNKPCACSDGDCRDE